MTRTGTITSALVGVVIGALLTLGLVAAPGQAADHRLGRMRITLAGLPDISAMIERPRVSVTRGGYQRVIHKSRKLGRLSPGTYTLTPDPVYLRDGRTFVSTPQKVKVRKGTTRTRLTYAQAPQKAGPAIWNILLIIVRNTDTDYIDDAGATRHMRASLPDDDVAQLRTAMATSVPQAVEAWSNGQVAWNVEIQESDVPITHLSDPGAGNQWVAPSDVRSAIDRFYRPGYHDQVMVYWRGSDDSGNSIHAAGWGVAQMQRSPDYGYTSVSYLRPGTWNPTTADMLTQVWIHEWLHNASAFFSDLGYDIPVGDADGAPAAGYYAEQPPLPGWGTYYAALMTAQVPHNGTLIGIPAGAWQRGSIRNWGKSPTRNLGGLSIADACTQQRGAGTTAHYGDFNDPYSWYCASPTAPYESVGGVDLDKACAVRYGAGATAALGERTAYGWYCQR